MLAASELPVSEHCGIGCMPTVPTSPITGIGVVDSLLWSLAIGTGLVKSPLLDNFLKVPLSELISGYAFGPGTPDYANFGPVFPGLGFTGTTTVVDPDGQPQYLMPWANTTFKLDLFTPFATYFDHLMADPSTNPIRLPNLVGLGRTLQTFAAGMVIAFDPIIPGRALCPNACANLPAQFDYPAVVKFIGDLWPGNENIDSWLTAYANGTANVPTQAQIDKNIELLENGQQFWSFGNTPLPDSSANKGFNPSSLAPFFHKLWTDLGLNPPPLNPRAPGQEPDDLHVPKDGLFTDLRASEKVSQPTLLQVGSTTTSTNATDDDRKSEPHQVSGSEPHQVSGSEPHQVSGSEPHQVSGSEPHQVSGVSDKDTPQDGPGGATPAAQGVGLTPPTGLNQLLPPLTGPKTPKTGTTSSTAGTGPNGSVPGTAPKTGNTPSLGKILKKFLPHKPGAATTNPGAVTSTDANSDGGTATK